MRPFDRFPVSPEAFEDRRLAPGARITVARIDGVWTAWPAGTEPEIDGPTASMYWFAAVVAYPDLELG